jgi:hypothetical protein
MVEHISRAMHNLSLAAGQVSANCKQTLDTLLAAAERGDYQGVSNTAL